MVNAQKKNENLCWLIVVQRATNTVDKTMTPPDNKCNSDIPLDS